MQYSGKRSKQGALSKFWLLLTVVVYLCNLVYTFQLIIIKYADAKVACKAFQCHASKCEVVELINFIESFSGSRAGGWTRESSDLINELDNGVCASVVQPSAGEKHILDSLFKSSIVRSLHFYVLFS